MSGSSPSEEGIHADARNASMQTAQHLEPEKPAADQRYARHAGFHVLRLSGDDYAMGHQHGAALRDAIAHGPVPYFERYVERMLGAGVGPLGAAAAVVLRRTVGHRVAAGFPPHARRALEGLADGAGVARDKLLGACTMPETYLWVVHKLIRLRGAAVAPRAGASLMGCTSAIAWGGATKDGSMLHGRNFDYQGV